MCAITGDPIPDIKKITEAYGLRYISCIDGKEVSEKCQEAMEATGAVVCEIHVDAKQEVIPRIKSIATANGDFIAPKYENLYPFLDEEELVCEMKKANVVESEKI